MLTVSKMAQPLQDSPSSVTIIDQEMIRASGYQDIPDQLRLVPGFSVAYTRDNYYAVGYHGIADSYSRRFQVLVDGRSIYMPNYGEVGWNRLPLAIEDIERIEVVGGKYGTQDKQDGVLGNIFANVEWQAQKHWLVQGGAQMGYHYFTGFEVSPRLAISYQFNPRHTLRWAASRATRSPTFFEENGNAAFYNSAGVLIDQQVIPSDGLDPEVNTSTEIGYLGL